MIDDPLSPEWRRRVDTAARLFPIEGPAPGRSKPPLSAMQQQIYSLYESGLPMAEIADKVGTTRKSVNAAIQNIRVKGYPLAYRNPVPEHRRSGRHFTGGGDE